MMAINTVAAGGGSILHFDGARLRVGPDSAGADPGPACYRRGGPLTVTDANVCVGKIQPAHFPAIFGPSGDQPLDADVVRDEIRRAGRGDRARHRHTRARRTRSPKGSCSIAVANMANAIKQVSVQKGHDATRFALQCFGGAGGQHACLVADALGMETVFIHPFAGVLSAYGMGLADQAVMREQAVEVPLVAGCHAGAGGAGRSAGRGCRRGAGEPGRRSRAHRHRAHAAPALCRHRGGAGRCADGGSIRSSPISPRRTARASALPRPTARWWWRRSRWKRRRRARRCGRRRWPRAKPARRRRSTRVSMFTGGAGARRAGVRPHRAAGGRPHRRAGADPRGQRDHRGRARLDRGDHADWTT